MYRLFTCLHSSFASCISADKNLFDYIQDEDLDTLRRYVERGGPVHVADTLGDTSLLVAACTGNVELMKVKKSENAKVQEFQGIAVTFRENQKGCSTVG